MNRLKNLLADNLKNLHGWRTARKLVAFAVDDYCSVRVASRAALEELRCAGLELCGTFDHFDSVETREDLEALFETLDCVRDSQNRPAFFTAYALSANPDFERIWTDGQKYFCEPVTETFNRLAAEQPGAYEGAWSLWQEGMERGFIRPQFHGREHLNVRLFEEKLKSGAKDLLVNLENRSLAGLKVEPSLPGVGFSQAFAVHNEQCLELQKDILKTGMRQFEECFGFTSTTFTPTGQVISPSLYPACSELGVQLIHKPRSVFRHLRRGQCVHDLSWTGKQHSAGHIALVRNAVFEPSAFDARASEERVIEQIRAAFRWRKPAIISSHRVNFCGHIDEDNRRRGLSKLRHLLQMIIREFPTVEFISVDELAHLINPKDIPRDSP